MLKYLVSGAPAKLYCDMSVTTYLKKTKKSIRQTLGQGHGIIEGPVTHHLTRGTQHLHKLPSRTCVSSNKINIKW